MALPRALFLDETQLLADAKGGVVVFGDVHPCVTDPVDLEGHAQEFPHGHRPVSVTPDILASYEDGQLAVIQGLLRDELCFPNVAVGARVHGEDLPVWVQER